MLGPCVAFHHDNKARNTVKVQCPLFVVPEGSVTIDADLMKAADIVEFERVEVYDITNGNRLATYAITGEAGSGIICLNGAAARLIKKGDLVIICSYADYTEKERAKHVPDLILVDSKNRVT